MRSKIRAVPMSHGLGITKRPGRSCNWRKAAAFSVCVGTIVDPLNGPWGWGANLACQRLVAEGHVGFFASQKLDQRRTALSRGRDAASDCRADVGRPRDSFGKRPQTARDLRVISRRELGSIFGRRDWNVLL